MKKKLLALALASVFSVPVLAQSSVTLYGIIDEGLGYTTNSRGHSAYQLTSGYAQGSRWGLKVAEDLGGGTKAIFTLENGFNLSNGALAQGGRMFGRQAYVGVTNSGYGTLTMGRQYDSLVDTFASVTGTAWGGYLFSTPYDNDNSDNTFRFSNSIKYVSPLVAGLRVDAAYAFSNDPNFVNNRGYSVGASYSLGGLAMAAAYVQANNPGATTSGSIETNVANFSSNLLRIFGGGASYTAGPVSVGLVYTNTTVNQPATTATSAYIGAITAPAGSTLTGLRFQNYEINAKYQMTPAFFVGMQYVYTAAAVRLSSGNSHPKYHTAGLMADYNFSKRTDLYAQLAYQQVGGGRSGTVLDYAYVPGSAGVSSNDRQLVVRLAMRHKF